MKRYAAALCACPLILLLTACATPGPILMTPRSSTVLFDPRPGLVSANDLVYRAEWPAVESNLSLGETTYFREYFFDQQNLNRFTNDFSFRRFQTYRSGTSVR